MIPHRVRDVHIVDAAEATSTAVKQYHHIISLK